MNYVHLILGLVAIAAAWDVARRFAGSKVAALQADVVALKAGVSLLNSIRDEEGLAARVASLESKTSTLKSLMESPQRKQRPWGGGIPRVGA